MIDSLLKAFSEKSEPTVFQNFLLSETTGLFLKKTSFRLAEQANTEISLAIKAPFMFLVSSF